MPAPPPDARACRAIVTAVERSGEDGAIVRVRPELSFAPVRASRFFMLKREDALSPLLPRPFSIYRQRGEELEFLLKVVGRGTRALAASRPGDALRMTGPLGNGWPTLSAPRAGEGPWVLLAGGIGSAPFYMGIEQALAGMDGAPPAQPHELVLLYGAARKGFLYELDAFRALGVQVHCATDDGSLGMRGNVLGLLRELWQRKALPERVRLLACGPERMLHATQQLAHERDLPCWLSLESTMGCGVGICNACPVPTRPEGRLGAWSNAKCCVEGPVFETAAIDLARV